MREETILPPHRQRGGRGKCLASLANAVSATGLKDGDTISFHHHLRNGDAVLNTVMDMLAAAGLSDLHLAVTSIFPVHAPLFKAGQTVAPFPERNFLVLSTEGVRQP